MRPRVLTEVPEQTVAVARAAFRRPTVAMRVRDELGGVFADTAFIDAWKHTYRARAGVEATIHQATAVTGIRRARYAGLGKVSLEHAFAAAAINLIRLHAWWTGTPIQRTRTTHLSRLDLTLAA